MGLPIEGDTRMALEDARLALRKTIIITLKGSFEPDWFFNSRSGLLVQEWFQYQIAKNARRVEPGTKFKLSIFDVVGDTYYDPIAREFGDNLFFDETAACAVVAKMIGRQENGEAGYLDNTNKENILYLTNDRVVYVLWAERCWHVYASGHQNVWLHPGVRILCPCN